MNAANRIRPQPDRFGDLSKNGRSRSKIDFGRATKKDGNGSVEDAVRNEKGAASTDYLDDRIDDGIRAAVDMSQTPERAVDDDIVARAKSEILQSLSNVLSCYG